MERTIVRSDGFIEMVLRAHPSAAMEAALEAYAELGYGSVDGAHSFETHWVAGIGAGTEGVFLPTVEVASGARASGQVPVAIQAVATCWHVATGTAQGMADTGVALDRLLNEFQDVAPVAGVVKFEWPENLDGRRDRSLCRRTQMLGATSFKIGALDATYNTAIANSNKRHVLTWRFLGGNMGGLALQPAVAEVGDMPIVEWAQGFSNPVVPAGGECILRASIYGNRAVLSYEILEPMPVFEYVGAAIAGTGAAGFVWPAHAAPANGVGYLLVGLTYNASFNSNDPPTAPTGANWITLGGGAINVTSPGTHRNGVGIHYKLAQSAAEAVGTLPADFNGSFGGAVFRICPIPANLADIFGTIASDFDASVSDTSFSQPAVDMEGNAGFVLQGSVLGSLTSGAHHILRAELEANKRVRTAGATSISVSALVTAWAAGSSTIGAASRKAAVAVPIFRPEDL